ncbi:hypothetical protein GCM10017691_44660 [Pseudonocardia petroleophila]
MCPWRIFQSTGFTPAARTAMRTSDGPGSGVGSSWISWFSGPPYCVNTYAFMPERARSRAVPTAPPVNRWCAGRRVRDAVRDPRGEEVCVMSTTVPDVLRARPIPAPR